jgi:hypothetical protein
MEYAPRLLRSWKEIADYCRKSERSLRRYQKFSGMPVCRFGRFVTASPNMIDVWLMQREKMRRERLQAEKQKQQTAQQPPPAA